MAHIEGSVVMCAMLLIASIHCDDCDVEKCAKIPKHYEELGCNEIKDNGTCCATRFNCPDFASDDATVCHLRDKQYNVSDKVDENDSPKYLNACRCTKIGVTTTFSCAIAECPEDFDDCGEDCDPAHPDPTTCISVFENVTDLCRSKEICDESEIARLPMCYDGDDVYRLGERFEPVAHLCHECLCTADYNNSTAIADNASCMRIDCGIVLRELARLRDGCVPVYFGDKRCCPIDIRCPTEDDHVMDGKLATGGSVDNACTFGNLTLQIGQQLDTSDKCSECECKIPPMITCTQFPNCDPSTR